MLEMEGQYISLAVLRNRASQPDPDGSDEALRVPQPALVTLG